VRRVTPFSRNTESYERSEETKQKALELVMPTPSTASASAEDSPNYEQDDRDVSIFEMDGSIYGGTDFGRDPDCEMSSNLIVMDSSDGENDEENSTLYNAFPAPPSEHEGCEASITHDLNTIEEEGGQRKSYGGFPQELLDGKDENRAPNYDSKTLPRLKGSHCSRSDRDTHVRERSFHDDRAILPSQKNPMAATQAENVVIVARSSSLRW
jgi:metal transporter CNNM